MKYQSRHTTIDPESEEKPSGLDFDFEDSGGSEISNDAYVIGPDGHPIDEPGGSNELPEDKRPHPWLKPAAVTLSVLFVVLTAWNLSRLTQGPPAPPKPTAVQSNQALYLGVMKIEAYRRVHGVVPDTLEQAGLGGTDAYAFKHVSQTRYVLSFRNRGAKFEYDSIEAPDRFFGSPKDMLKMGDSR